MQKTSSPSFSEIAQRLGPQIDAALDVRTSMAESAGCPARLREAMRYSLLAPGKRFRPILTLLASEACGGDRDAAMPSACAVEMVHAYSLIHDDLPAMDDDDLRRGRPTCHRKFDEATAILAGDGLLTLAFEILAKEIQPSATAAACCAALAEAAGACNMVGGQTDDIDAETESLKSRVTVSGFNIAGGDSQEAACAGAVDSRQQLSALEFIHRRKTGAMIRASLKLGALTAGAAAEQLAALESFGHCIGLAFQITDDLLDVLGDSAVAGKRVGKDAEQGKLTYPRILGVQQSLQYAKSLTMEACQAIEIFGPAGEGLQALACFVLERNR
jgi:geranylgeranyl diphosphate synthase, type II